MTTDLVMERLNSIQVMLEAYHKGLKNLHWIEGYVVGAAETEGIDDNRGVYVLLYGIGEGMPNPCVKVYKSESSGLPLFIKNAVEWDNPDKYGVLSAKTTEKPNAIKKGVYNLVPRFCIVRYDGKETQMGPQKMFGGVVKWSSEAREAEQSERGGSKPMPQAVQQKQQVQQAQQPQPKQQVQQNPAPKLDNNEHVEWAVSYGVFDTIDEAAQKYGEVLAFANQNRITDIASFWRDNCLAKYAVKNGVFKTDTEAKKELPNVKMMFGSNWNDGAWARFCQISYAVAEGVYKSFDEAKPPYTEFRKMMNPQSEAEMWQSWKSKVASLKSNNK